MSSMRRTFPIAWAIIATIVAVSEAMWMWRHQLPATDYSGIAYVNALKAEASGDLDGATAQYMVAVDRDPLHCGVYQELGRLMERQNQNAEAIAFYRRALVCFNGRVVHVIGGHYPESARKWDIRATTKRIEALSGSVTSTQ